MKQFEVYAPLTKSLDNSKVDSGALIIEGIASTTNKDLVGDVITPEAIVSMKKQAVNKHVYANHNYDPLHNLIGKIQEVVETDDDSLKIKALILPSYAPTIRELLDNDIQLGFSIGGMVSNFKSIGDGGFKVNEFDLKEVSLTGMPANWDTFGTVTTAKGLVKSTCLGGACYTVLKNQKEDEFNLIKTTGGSMSDENNINTQNTKNEENRANDNILTVDEATALFNELMANKQEEIKSEIMDSMQNDIKKIVQEAVDKATGKQKPKEGEVEETTVEEINKAIAQLNDNMLKSQEELFKRYIETNAPTPTKKPTDTSQKSAGRKYTNKELFETMQKNKAPGIFDMLGIKE